MIMRSSFLWRSPEPAADSPFARAIRAPVLVIHPVIRRYLRAASGGVLGLIVACSAAAGGQDLKRNVKDFLDGKGSAACEGLYRDLKAKLPAQGAAHGRGTEIEPWIWPTWAGYSLQAATQVQDLVHWNKNKPSVPWKPSPCSVLTPTSNCVNSSR